MAARSIGSILSGAPQLDQLEKDLRAAELALEAPRYSVSDPQSRELHDKFTHSSIAAQFEDMRVPHLTTPIGFTQFKRIIGELRLHSGDLVLLAFQPPFANVLLRGRRPEPK